jgi:hypothetical protein
MSKFEIRAKERFGLRYVLAEAMDRDWFARLCAVLINTNAHFPGSLQIKLNKGKEEEILPKNILDFLDGNFDFYFDSFFPLKPDSSLKIVFNGHTYEVSASAILETFEKESSIPYLSLTEAENNEFDLLGNRYESIVFEIPDNEQNAFTVFEDIFSFKSEKIEYVFFDDKRDNTDNCSFTQAPISPNDILHANNLYQPDNNDLGWEELGLITGLDLAKGEIHFEHIFTHIPSTVHFCKEQADPAGNFHHLAKAMISRSLVVLKIYQYLGRKYLIEFDVERAEN